MFGDRSPGVSVLDVKQAGGLSEMKILQGHILSSSASGRQEPPQGYNRSPILLGDTNLHPVVAKLLIREGFKPLSLQWGARWTRVSRTIFFFAGMLGIGIQHILKIYGGDM